MSASPPKSKAGRDAGGRFLPGNGGRPKGSRNRVNQALDRLFSSSAADVAASAIEAAKSGDVAAMRLVLERAFPAPKDRHLSPIELPGNPGEAMARVVEAVAAGTLLPSEGERLAALLKARAELATIGELEARLAALEAKN